MGDQIREAVKASGLSNRRISQQTGIDEPRMSRFLHGEIGLQLAALNELAALLDLRVVVGPNAVKPADFPDRRFKKTKSKR